MSEKLVTTETAVSLVRDGLENLAARCRNAGRPDIAREISHWPRPGVEWTVSDWEILTEELSRVQTELLARDDWRASTGAFFAVDFAGGVAWAATHVRRALHWRGLGEMQWWRGALAKVPMALETAF